MRPTAPPGFADFESSLHAAARSATGLEDFGAPDYLPGLRRLIASFATDLPASEATRRACFEMTLPGLVGRLHTQEGWKRNPACLEDRLERPVVIAGIPRTGTTALHKLLALDPRFQVLESWLIPNPIVRPPRTRWDEHPFYRDAVERVRTLKQTRPAAWAAHDVAAHEPDECLGLMMQSFVTNQLPSLLDLPSYDDWYLAQDEAASYVRLADNLRLIGHGEIRKTWLLKNPTHLLRMKSLLDVFPDAHIIVTHREPVATMTSMCRMLAAFRGLEAGDPAARAIGPRQLRVYAQAVAHTAEVRKRSPNAFHDVFQSELRADPLLVVRGIYDRFGLELEAETAARMQHWAAASATMPRLESRDTPEDYGLTRDEILSVFSSDLERIGS
jgi:hypothetical protein